MKKSRGMAKRVAAACLAAMMLLSQVHVSVLADELTKVPGLTEISELPGMPHLI